jgi:DNA repair protein RecO (recombination protein O)
MESTVSAIVLRRRDAGETDRKLIVLTRELGKTEVTAKGARKPASRLAGCSDPLTVAQLGIALGKRNRFITQAQPQTSFRGLRADYERLSFALSLCELYAAILPWEEPSQEAYDLLIDSLGHLERHARPSVALIWSQVKLLALSGFLPQFDRCVVTESPVAEGAPFMSPRAGGYVTDAAAIDFTDRYRTRAEVLYGLARLHEFDAPPSNMKFVEEALADLLPFWHHVAEVSLPATESAVRELRNPT